jgi:ADP-heptose:LPS heptosyltransferase
MNYLQRIKSKVRSLFFRILYKSLDLALLVIGRLSRIHLSDTLLIIRPDAIGDYILFRNFLPFIRQSLEYRNTKIILLCNKRCRALAEYFDNAHVDKFIWMEQSKYRKHGVFEFLYSLLIDLSLYKTFFNYIFYPVFSRTNFYDELINKLSAKHKITCSGDDVNKGDQPDITDRVYTRVIPTEQKVGVFEFERNREIIEKFLCQKIDLEYPYLRKLPEYKAEPLPSGYVVVCTEASSASKEWLLKHFKTVIDYIVNNKGIPVVLLGLDNSVNFPEKQIIDLRGKTTLPETASVLSKACCFIGNDSALLHIAAAVGIKRIIAICYGAYYGRFAPYPKIDGRDYRFVFPPEIEENKRRQDYLKQKYAVGGRYEDISLIEPGKIKDILEKML